MTPSLFAPVPPEISKALQGFEIQNHGYLAVGDRISPVLESSGLDLVDFAPEKSRSYVAMLALATLFEFAEGYTDQEAAEAARNRMEWKYALHLPIAYPGFEASWLCKFRAYAFRSVDGSEFLQTLAQRLQGIAPHLIDLSGTKQPSDILTSICQLNRVVQLAEAMLLAVEALAAQSFVVPDGVPLHLLYASYARTLRALRERLDADKILQIATATGEDIAWLLRSLENTMPAGISLLPEVIHLRQVWQEQFGWEAAGESPESACPAWKPVDCEHCGLRAA